MKGIELLGKQYNRGSLTYAVFRLLHCLMCSCVATVGKRGRKISLSCFCHSQLILSCPPLHFSSFIKSSPFFFFFFFRENYYSLDILPPNFILLSLLIIFFFLLFVGVLQTFRAVPSALLPVDFSSNIPMWNSVLIPCAYQT